MRALLSGAAASAAASTLCSAPATSLSRSSERRHLEMPAHRVELFDLERLLLRLVHAPAHDAGRLGVELDQAVARVDRRRDRAATAWSNSDLIRRARNGSLSLLVCSACSPSALREPQVMRRHLVVRLDGLLEPVDRRRPDLSIAT